MRLASQRTLTMFVGVVALRYQHHTTQSEKTRHFRWSYPLTGNASCVFKTQNS